MKSDFQAGVDKIYNACKTYGSTPSASTPAACETSIKAIYDARYTSGYNAGVTAGKAACRAKLREQQLRNTNGVTYTITGYQNDYVYISMYNTSSDNFQYLNVSGPSFTSVHSPSGNEPYFYGYVASSGASTISYIYNRTNEHVYCIALVMCT
jgi:hypothetical protein